ncbi:FSR family fosmidomycin resistance protein-like MFS transporter [Prosthecobacter fusiformis]|uniref:FSR family fosmidomycin resistance protein-like MFS transporter n=1 Tax=Prosthecobacter fusiformis TaxID=48464 RepID=A0A4R7RY41_9BACT|nr:MFS transporter [Prosthecobacter fusiformis]TDU70830.1 FSR family fosmidomycin resistance protein-like MFS transporter [Prosthecobacter fusiformis]
MNETVIEEMPPRVRPQQKATETVFALLFAISFSHMLNDTIQALLPAIYPVLKESYGLTFTQLGLITLTFQCTASLLQPLVGYITDKRAMPYSLPVGMGLTLVGLLLLSQAHTFPAILIASAMVGSGSAIFHPEASRIAHMAAGKRRGLAQSLFQVGGNAGTSIGPLLAAWFIVPHGQAALSWFSIIAMVGVLVLFQVGQWQGRNLHRIHKKRAPMSGSLSDAPATGRIAFAVAVLVILIFSKYVYLASLTNYYTFYLMDRFQVSVQHSQYYLFIFLFSVAAGTIIGGPVGDAIGRKRVIWVSILGVAPFSLWLPHAGLLTTAILTVIIGLVLASAFSAILVYAQELMPGKVGMIAGLFFGLAFGIAGIGSAVLGAVADKQGINFVFHACAYLPLLGLLTVFLPDVETAKEK